MTLVSMVWPVSASSGGRQLRDLSLVSFMTSPTHIVASSQPHIGTFSPVHAPLDVLLDELPSVFREILMLVFGFALPIVDAEGSENVSRTLGNFNACAVGNELVHSSPFSYFILESVNEFSLG